MYQKKGSIAEGFNYLNIFKPLVDVR